MSRVSPLDESEEGEIRPEQYRYSAGDRGDHDRDRRDKGIAYNSGYPNRRVPPVVDNRTRRDSSLDTDRIRKDLQAALSRPDGSLDSAVLAELLRSSNRKDTLERLLDREREFGSNRPPSSRDRSSPELRRDDRQYLRGRDSERDRREFGRDRPPSVGSIAGELAPSNRDNWYGNRNRSHDGPGNRDDSHHWPRTERPSIRTSQPSFSRPSMLATQQQASVHAQGRARSGSDVESTDEWRRQQRSNILSAGPAALRTTPTGPVRTHASRWSDGPTEDRLLQAKSVQGGGQLRSPPPKPVGEAVVIQAGADAPPAATPGDGDELYDISDGEEGEEVTVPVETADVPRPAEQDVPGTDTSLELDLETLSLGKVVSVLEEMERSERSLHEQLRGMNHELEVGTALEALCSLRFPGSHPCGYCFPFQDKTRQLTKMQHSLDKEAARVAAKEEQARLSKEERTRIAVAHEVLRQRRRNMLEQHSSSSTVSIAFETAKSDVSAQCDDGWTVAWSVHTTPQSLQSVSDILRANRYVVHVHVKV
jgi:hypothetical protein